ncbi:MAG: hypothetical protein RL698_1022 [Pseudomonadota bacterium]
MTAAGFSGDAAHDWPEPTILPEQHYARSSEGSPMRGVNALMIAVLEDAIACLETAKESRNVKARMLAMNAERWIRSEDTSYAFAFASICDVLSLDRGKVRDELLRRARATFRAGPRPPSARRVEIHLSKITAPRRRRRPTNQLARQVA